MAKLTDEDYFRLAKERYLEWFNRYWKGMPLKIENLDVVKSDDKYRFVVTISAKVEYGKEDLHSWHLERELKKKLNG